jgi:hypothetical protein
MTTPPAAQPDEMREFMLMLRQALLMIVAWIERRYRLERKP